VIKIVTENGRVRYGTLRYGTLRYGTLRYGTLRYGTVRYGTLRYGTVRYGTVRTRYGVVDKIGLPAVDKKIYINFFRVNWCKMV
jgi:hypothetical protein